MKPFLTTAGVLAIFSAALSGGHAGEVDREALKLRHQDGSTKLADEQDELSADVQQLALEQTVPKVIELLTEVEDIMAEATDWLADYDTGGRTIAAQTEIIEKIYEASKERQKQQGSGQSGGAMMDMMERMMGKGQGEGQGEGEGEGEGDEGGQGSGGDSDTANENVGGVAGGNTTTRRVPKAAGTAGRALPEEFRRALEAYNRGLEQPPR
jgi:hypothetical protein